LSGQVPLKDVIEVVSDEKPKKFQLILQGRLYKFEASSVPEKHKWVNAIEICRAYSIYFEEKSKEQMLALDADIRFEENSIHEDDPRKQANFNPLGMIASSATKIFVGAAIKTSVGIVKSSVNSVGNAFGGDGVRSNDEYFKVKKFKEAFDSIDPKILKSRLIAGYIWKETKEATGVGLVDDFVNSHNMRETIARRWCLLVSSKPIVFDLIDPSDEATLDTGKLPFEIEPELFYVYDDGYNETKPFQTIELKDVIDLVVKKKTPDEQFYRFIIDMGDHKINFMVGNITEMTNWVKAIQAARANSKEKTKSKLPTVKNLYWHFKILAEEGEEKLKEKINKDYDLLTKGAGIITSDNIRDLIRLQENVAEEFLAAVNACLAHKDQRIDVVRIYIETAHELILNALKIYFKKNQDCLENKDIFELIKFLIWYCEKLQIFGNAFVDQRMIDGISTLCRIVEIRVLKNNMRSIKNIVKQEIENEPEIDGRGRAATMAPNDVFKLCNESFNILFYCNTKELSLAILEACSYTLIHLQNGLNYTLDTCDLSLDQLCAFCNNAFTYTNNIKDFGKQVEQLDHINKDTLKQNFDENAFNKIFVVQGKKAYEQIAHKVFIPLKEQWDKTPFLEIRLEKSVGAILETLAQYLDKIHSNFTNKIEALGLEKSVAFYLQAFLFSADKKKFKSGDLQKITAKLESDQEVFTRLFPNLKSNVVENSISPITQFVDFLTTNYSFLPMAVQNLKEQYGNAIKYSTIELLIKLRNDPLSKDERNEIFNSCEEIYNTTKKASSKEQNFNVFKQIKQNYEDTTETNLKTSTNLNGSFSEDETESDSGRPRFGSGSSTNAGNTSFRSVISVNIEGFLEVDRGEIAGTTNAISTKFEVKYFNLKRDVLYFYKDKTSEFSQGSYRLKDLTDSGTFDEDHNIFYLTMKTKDYDQITVQFKASNPEKRDEWLESIREASKIPDLGAMIQLNASDFHLFKETRALFADIEDMPNLDFNLNLNPQAASRKNSIFTNTSAKTSVASPEGKMKRKKSFDLNGPLPSQNSHVQQGCVAKICNIFGKSNKNDYDYASM